VLANDHEVVFIVGAEDDLSKELYFKMVFGLGFIGPGGAYKC